MKSETGRATRLAAGGGLALAALLLSAAPIMAEQGGTAVGVGVTVGPGTANSSSQSGSVAVSESNSVAASGTVASGNSTQGQSLSINSKTPSTQTIKNVPTVYAPGLAAAGSEVCLGSMS